MTINKFVRQRRQLYLGLNMLKINSAEWIDQMRKINQFNKKRKS